MSPKGGFGLAAIRALAFSRSEQQSLRKVAREIGISYTGLRFFLKGSKPQSETLRRLVAWYGTAKGSGTQVVDPQDVRVAVSMLSRYLQTTPTPSQRKQRFESMIRALLSELDPQDRRLLLTGLVDRQGV